MTDDGATMTLIEHLEELRRRLIVVVVAVLFGAVLGFVVAPQVVRLLVQPLPDAYQTLYFTTPGGAFAAQLKIAGFIGIALAMPVLLYEGYRFITPGLTAHERRIVWPALGAAVLLFALGIVIGYVVIPFVLNFLLTFTIEGTTQPLLTIDEYIGFVTTMMLAFGLLLEFPIVLVVLARIGILNYGFLSRRRRWAVLLITVIAIVMTPGGDPFSPAIIGIVMYLLFEASLLIIRRFRR